MYIIYFKVTWLFSQKRFISFIWTFSIILIIMQRSIQLPTNLSLLWRKGWGLPGQMTLTATQAVAWGLQCQTGDNPD